MRIFIYHSFVCAKETEKRFAVGSTPHHNEIIVTIREDTRKDDATAYNLYIDDSNSLVSRIQSSWTQNKVAYLLLAHTKIAWIPYTTHPICISNTGECVYVASIARNKCHKSLWSMLVFRVVYVEKSGKIKMQELVGLFAAAIVRLQRKACACKQLYACGSGVQRCGWNEWHTNQGRVRQMRGSDKGGRAKVPTRGTKWIVTEFEFLEWSEELRNCQVVCRRVWFAKVNLPEYVLSSSQECI